MDHPKTFLICKIIHYKTNGLKTLGRLNAEHVDDVSEVMKEFAEGLLLEIIYRLKKGEEIDVNGTILSLKPITHATINT